MPSTKIRLSYLLTFTAGHLALALGRIADDRVLWRWTSRFCGSEPGDCSLGAPDAEALVHAVHYLLDRYRGARASTVQSSIARSLEGLFWTLHDAIEHCLDINDEHCVCSWQRRMRDAEELVPFLVEVARAYWSTGANREWMFKALERLACRAADVAEGDGSIARRAADDVSVEARADRLAVLLFDTANDLVCNSWAEEEWMSVVPGQ